MIDIHTHCNCSFDGDDPIEKMCQKALDLGLLAYGISDHCEINRFFPDYQYGKVQTKDTHSNFQYDFENSMNQISGAQKKFSNLNLLSGVELGQPLFDAQISDKIFNDKRLDYIICSIHELPPLEDFYYLDYSSLDPDKLLHDYFNQILLLTEWGHFNILAHFTYPLQYMTDYDINANLEKFKDIILKIFQNMVEKDIALEINCSTVYDDIADTIPNLELIKLFHDVGGKYISLGSDAHCAEAITSGIEKGIENAKKAGFKGSVYFKKRCPIFCEF